MVPPDARVADIGTDHGNIANHMIIAGISTPVNSRDLSKGPL